MCIFRMSNAFGFKVNYIAFLYLSLAFPLSFCKLISAAFGSRTLLRAERRFECRKFCISEELKEKNANRNDSAKSVDIGRDGEADTQTTPNCSPSLHTNADTAIPLSGRIQRGGENTLQGSNVCYFGEN